jgi:hypothetical protein
MAFGQLQGGGLMDPPAVQGLGVGDWTQMTGMNPAHPLVGGTAGRPGYETGQRQVFVADSSMASQAAVASGSPMRANWTEIFNLKGNPIGWVLIAAILYLGLMHIHVRAGASGAIGAGK